MSKPRDPVIAVIKYFQEAELPLAQQALSLAHQIVRARAPSSRPRPVVKKAATLTNPARPAVSNE
jgi:hypothetical protein